MTEETNASAGELNIAQTVHEITRKFDQVEQITTGRVDGGSTILLSVPKGRELVDVEKFLEPLRERPRFLTGTARHENVESLIVHANRFKDGHSALYLTNPADGGALLTVIYDYHEEHGKPRHGKHKAEYAFPFSEEFEAWRAGNKKAMGQQDFAEFIEDRILDVVAPPPRDKAGEGLAKIFDYADKIGGDFASPQRMMELSRGLQARIEEKMVNSISLQTGEVVMEFTHQHRDSNGEKLKVPGLFLIAVPVFEGGASYQLLGRLRYRPRGGTVTWFYELFRVRETVDHAVSEVAGRVSLATKLPLFRGTAE